MTSIQVRHLAKNRYHVSLGRHSLTVDQPITAGGEDEGPTAVQLFAASLIACTAHYAGSYLARHGLSTEGLVVDGEFAMASDRPARVVSLSVGITPPVNLPANRKAGLLAVASQCTVHHTIRQPPAIDIVLSEPAEAADDDEARHVSRPELVGVGVCCSSSDSTPSATAPTAEVTKERP